MTSFHPSVSSSRIHAILFWLTGLSPVFFAAVVWNRSQWLSGPFTWGQSRTRVVAHSWRFDAGLFYGGMVLLVALAVVVAAMASSSGSRPGRGLISAFLIMYAGPVISAAFGGHDGLFDWQLWLAPLLLVACYLAPPIGLEQMTRLVRPLLRFYMWGSLAALAVVPEWAIAPSFINTFSLEWLTPGGRLAGLTNHPISLGVLAAVALVVECVPLHRGRGWQLHCAVAAFVLLLSQTRTAWLAAAAALPFLYRRDSSRLIQPMVGRALAFGIVVCVAAVMPAVPRQLSAIGDSAEVTSLHGRTLPWEMALDAFRSNVLLGYGPTLFTDVSSPVHGAFDHAHDQLFQTLATAGLLGAAGLLVLAGTLTVVAVRTARASAGLSVALTVLTVVICVPEAPLRGEGFTAYLLLTVVLFTVLRSALCDAGAQEAGHVPRPAAAPECAAQRQARIPVPPEPQPVH
ncbi:O-antigen ligase family protein [Streptomyces sp. NBC_01615]|uniref:O-antigen ligase family protein n=1 Tax=Streptomyces sp. NBC_01615 TaxID=2975898 RepID=UPI00386642D5